MMTEYLILLIALGGIVLGADILVVGAVSIARKYHISEFVIGAAIVGIGTSMPELVVSFIGAVQGNADVAIGNVVGSNIFNILGILGITAIFFPITIDKDNMKFEIPVCIFVSVLLTILVFNFINGNTPTISSADGIVLLATFGLFFWYSFHRDKKKNEYPNESSDESHSPLWLSVLKVIGGLAILITSCDIFVNNAIHMAKALGVNDAFISLTLIACGTSLPELAASVAAAIKKNTQLALGNIIGSNIFNITFILGISSQVMTLKSAGISIVDYLVMIAAAIVPLILGIKGKIGRFPGLLMLISFILYTLYLLCTQVS